MVPRFLECCGLIALVVIAGCNPADGDPSQLAGPGTGGTGEVNASLGGRRPFPDDNPWNTAIDQAPVDPNSANLIAGIGSNTRLHPDFGADYDGGPFGIPYVLVDGGIPGTAVSFDYDSESDPGPYPIPDN